MRNDASNSARGFRPRGESRPVGHGSSFRQFTWAVRVYHEDCDGAGVVYHAGYLRFLERARTEWLRALGFPQSALAARHRIAFVVRALAIDYLRPARYDDTLVVGVALEALKGGSILLAQEVARDGATLASARVKIACVNTGSFRPVRIPGVVSAAIDRCGV